MKITTKAAPKEIAALVVALQERRSEERRFVPLDIIQKAVRSTIDDTEQAGPLSS